MGKEVYKTGVRSERIVFSEVPALFESKYIMKNFNLNLVNVEMLTKAEVRTRNNYGRD